MVGWDVIGPVAIIAIVAGIYYYFNEVDAKKNKKDADVYVQKTMADTEVEKLKIQQKELELKREYFQFEREKLQPRIGDSIKAEYKVHDQLEDKTNIETEPEVN
jgi:predicted membrane protein